MGYLKLSPDHHAKIAAIIPIIKKGSKEEGGKDGVVDDWDIMMGYLKLSPEHHAKIAALISMVEST